MAFLDFSIIVDDCHPDLWRGTRRLAQAEDEEDFTNPYGFELQRRNLPQLLKKRKPRVLVAVIVMLVADDEAQPFPSSNTFISVQVYPIC